MRKSLQISTLCILAIFSLSSMAEARMSPRQIYKSKADGVVLIVASKEGSSSASAGTGSVIRADGLVITNCHVIMDKTTKKPFPVIHIFRKPAKVTGNMNKDLKHHHGAKVLGYDEALDLALLQMKTPPAKLVVQTLGDPDELGPGDETIAIGHPESGGLWTITTGVIGTQFEDFKGVPGKHVFQMETSLNRGNSGGPLFDVRGYQVGVNTAIARKGQGGVAITGVNFAVKINVVKTWLAKRNVIVAYGTEPLDGEAPVRVAHADTSRPKDTRPTETPIQPDRHVPDRHVAVKDSPAARVPDQVKTNPPAAEVPAANTGKTTLKDPDGKGSITIEDDPKDSAQATTTQPDRQPEETAASRTTTTHKPTATTRVAKKRKPVRFKKYYRLPPRPYTFGRLFTAVEKVHANAEEAFDDLDREIRRRGR
ncbi:MAG: trypsin-like peptidase domain-containing protein [Deltaproteobacteria bacterium]|nr:trypsin-like peptidase domain-containing protein [Deltaproteobacteria bacterium]